jgi:lauroyl/myristoyl acyltransferase
MNEIRTKFGVRVTPISVQALREAVHRLKSGGVVVIAADVPVESGAEMIFFRRKTRLPIGHARLASKTGAKMIVGTSTRLANGLYKALGVQVHEPKTTGDPDKDILRWAQQSLFLLEGYLRERPHEWFMPIALWQQSLDQEREENSWHALFSVDPLKLPAIEELSNNLKVQ